LEGLHHNEFALRCSNPQRSSAAAMQGRLHALVRRVRRVCYHPFEETASLVSQLRPRVWIEVLRPNDVTRLVHREDVERERREWHVRVGPGLDELRNHTPADHRKGRGLSAAPLLRVRKAHTCAAQPTFWLLRKWRGAPMVCSHDRRVDVLRRLPSVVRGIPALPLDQVPEAGGMQKAHPKASENEDARAHEHTRDVRKRCAQTHRSRVRTPCDPPHSWRN
jgi:hypothetical protein